MKLHNTLKKGIIGLIAMVALSIATPSLFANIPGRWIHHPAACLRNEYKESQVDRIMEGNRYVYFAVRGSAVKKDINNVYSTYYEIDPIQIFVYDKGLVWCTENIKPLSHEFEMPVGIPVAFNYSSELGAFMLVDEYNNTSILYDNGDIVVSKVLKDMTIPKQNLKPYTINFDEDNNLAYIAGSYGYISLNLSSGNLVDYAITDKAISWINRVGANLVIFAGKMSEFEYSTETYIYPVGEVPCKLENPISGAKDLQALMPLTHNTFAALAPGKNDAANRLKRFTIDDEGVICVDLTEELLVDDGSNKNYRHFFRTDGYVLPTKDGYAIHCQSDIYLLKKGFDEVSNIISKNALTSWEKASKSSVYEGDKIWLYTYESGGNTDMSQRGFYFYEMEGNDLGVKSDIFAPSGPSNIFANYCEWNNRYGLLLRGPGSSLNYGYETLDFICSFNDGKWKDRSFAAHNSLYSRPTESAKYVVSDSFIADSSHIWGCTPYGGMHRIDMENYESFVGIGTKYSGYNSWPNTYPGYNQILNFPPSHAVLANFSNVGFDVNGNMWFAQFRPQPAYYDYEDITNANMPLYYLTPEERLKLSDGVFPNLLEREIAIPGVSQYHNSRLIVLQSEGKRSHIVVSPNFYERNDRHLVIFDYNGTPENQSDDRYIICDELFDENGEKIYYSFHTGLYEDLETGKLWFLTSSGPFIMDTEEILQGKQRVKRFNIKMKFGIETNENPFEFVSMKYISDDKFGRKWIASDVGLYCLSEDSEELLAHFTIENSQLPSNDVLNVVCSPLGSVFILTARGMVEFQPEDSLNIQKGSSHLSIYPSVLTPDYKGYVQITGAEEGSEYIILNQQGDVIESLGNPIGGMFQWNPKGKAQGNYNIRRKQMEEENLFRIL